MAARKNTHVNDETYLKVGMVRTECAHIIPESTYFDVSTMRTSSSQKVRRFIFLMLPELIVAQRDYVASVLAALERFGYNVQNLNGSKVHSLHNVMTMEKNAHDWFDRLEMWFERTVSAAFILFS
jgi:hypothetical protein